MAEAYKSISENLLFMDKWTQFDWSLTLPDNAFFQKISNPLLVEADIFGEFFGKGYLPLMLKKHITEKIAYCEEFHPKGYVAENRPGRQRSFWKCERSEFEYYECMPKRTGCGENCF